MPQVDKVLVFDIWGDYAHFRKIETTTSPLTYSFPTGTALAGIIAAILGLGRDSYYELFSKGNVKFAVRILHPIKKTTINLNLIDTSRGFYLWDIKENPRTIVPCQFIKQPKYRIYIWLSDKERYKELKNHLENHQTIYTLYLGISELIANFSFIGEFDIKAEGVKGEEEIHSIIKKDKVRMIVEEGKRYALESVPLFMDKDRMVLEYGNMVFETNGKPLKINQGEFYKIGRENVIFF